LVTAIDVVCGRDRDSHGVAHHWQWVVGHPGIGIADLDDPSRPRPERLRSKPRGADGHQPPLGGMIDDAAIDP
jgi:hypothetical protein